MKRRSRFRKRLLILAVVVLVLAGGGVGAWFYRQQQIDERALRDLEEGREALEEGHSGPAVTKLRRYLERNEDDPEALRDYAKAIEEHSPSNPEQIKVAVGHMRRALALDPGLENGRRELMRLYRKAGYDQEALGVAEEILGRDPDDPDALWTATVARDRLGDKEEALETAKRYLAVRPDDRDARYQVLSLLVDLKRPDQEIVDFGFAGNGTDVRSRLLQATALMLGARRSDASNRALTLAEDELPDRDYVLRLIGLLDSLGEIDASTSVMTRAARDLREAGFARALVRRLWERREYGQVVETVDGLDVGKRGSTTLGIYALSLAGLERGDEAAAQIERIRELREDVASSAWVALLPAFIRPATPETVADRVTAARTAVRKLPQEPIFHYLLGNAWEGVGEQHLAVKEWEEASKRSATWAQPALRAGRMLMIMGQVTIVEQILDLAKRRWSEAPEGKVLELLLKSRGLGQMTATERSDLARRLARAPRESELLTLPLRISIEASENGRKAAAAAVEQVLARKDPGPPELLVRLAWLSRTLGLDMQDECLERCRQVHGPTVTATVFRAQDLAVSQRPEEGLDVLDAAAKANPSDPEYALARVLYMERIGKETRPEWAALLDAYPRDFRVLRGVLSSQDCWEESGFVSRAIDRLRAVTGDEGIQWRIARSHYVWKYARDDEKQMAESVTLLRGVLDEVPYLRSVRILLGGALMKLDNRDAAVDQFTIVSSDGPVIPMVEVTLANLLNAKGDSAGARDHLDRLLRVQELAPQTLLEAASLLASQGDASEALGTLGRIPDEQSDETGDRALLRARLLASLGRREEAERSLSTALENPTLPGVLFALRYYGIFGPIEKGDRWLGELSKFELSPSIRLTIQGDYYSLTNRPQESLSSLREAVKEDAENGAACRALIKLLIRLGQDDEAAAVVEQSAAGPLDYLEPGKDIVRDALRTAAFRPLLLAWVDDKEKTKPVLDAIRLGEGFDSGRVTPGDCAVRLARLAEENSGFWELQRFAADLLSRIDDSGEALRIASRLVARFPDRAEAHILQVRLLLRAGREDEALVQARQWRRQVKGGSPVADRLLAEVEISTGSPKEAIALLEPLYEKADSSADVGLVALLARARVDAGDGEEAAELFFSRCDDSVAWRMAAADFAARHLPTAAQAESWLARIEGISAEMSEDERYALSGAWLVCHRRFENDRYLERSSELIEGLEGEGLDARQCVLIGMRHEGTGNLAAAETSYRRALQLEPDLVIPKNNLAMILARQGDVEEALKLARGIVEAHPSVAELRDTLSFVLRRAGREEDAIAELEAAAKLEPANLKWRVRLADLCLEAGEIRQARKHHDAVVAALNGGRTVPSDATDLWKTVEERLR